MNTNKRIPCSVGCDGKPYEECCNCAHGTNREPKNSAITIYCEIWQEEFEHCEGCAEFLMYDFEADNEHD